MIFNYIWVSFFFIACFVALFKLIFLGDFEIFSKLLDSLFENAKSGFTISLGLTGVLAFWLGLMKIGERAGIVSVLSKFINPFFCKIFPSLPANSPAFGSIIMNFASNMLGLDNAATPLGLKAMDEMQACNAKKDTASDPMIMFLVLNTSGLTLIPISVIMYRIQAGAANPTDIFLPILLATFFATLAGFLAVCIKQRINIFQPIILSVLLSLLLFVVGTFVGLSQLSQAHFEIFSKLLSSIIVFFIILTFLFLGLRKGIDLFDSFIEGAKEGFNVAVRIIPYLIAVLVAVGLFRASGSLDLLTDGLAYLINFCGIDTQFVDALPTAFMKPLSGSGARGMMVESMAHYGADSFVGRLSSIFQGATDTTFYIIAVYFGSVGIRNTRYALGIGLFADFVGILAAIFICYFFFA